MFNFRSNPAKKLKNPTKGHRRDAPSFLEFRAKKLDSENHLSGEGRARVCAAHTRAHTAFGGLVKIQNGYSGRFLAPRRGCSTRQNAESTSQYAIFHPLSRTPSSLRRPRPAQPRSPLHSAAEGSPCLPHVSGHVRYTCSTLPFHQIRLFAQPSFLVVSICIRFIYCDC